MSTLDGMVAIVTGAARGKGKPKRGSWPSTGPGSC